MIGYKLVVVVGKIFMCINNFFSITSTKWIIEPSNFREEEHNN